MSTDFNVARRTTYRNDPILHLERINTMAKCMPKIYLFKVTVQHKLSFSDLIRFPLMCAPSFSLTNYFCLLWALLVLCQILLYFDRRPLANFSQNLQILKELLVLKTSSDEDVLMLYFQIPCRTLCLPHLEGAFLALYINLLLPCHESVYIWLSISYVWLVTAS